MALGKHMMTRKPPRRNVYFNPNRVDQIDLLEWIQAKIDAGLSFSHLAKVALNEKMETELKGEVKPTKFSAIDKPKISKPITKTNTDRSIELSEKASESINLESLSL
jgi:hypothetical protein